MFKKVLVFLFFCSIYLWGFDARSQCNGIMEPGFAFLSSSRGCAPFTVNIQTLYLSSIAGTQYYVDWGDGTAEQTYTQVGPIGVTMTHTYPNSSIDCGYDVTIDASNGCNPRGSVVPIQTQVIVWTNDVISIGPAVYRVCQGYAANVLFTDNSDWNCFPRLTRENNEPRWIQWIYGTGAAGIRIPGVQVNGVTPGAYPYLDPAPGRNPIYPVLSPGQVSLPMQVPVTLPADIGKEFEITLKNWNQCNAYDNNVLDGNAFNPVNGNLINGDNGPQVTTARIVIVDAPSPSYVTRLGSSGGPVQSVFCIGDDIYFQNNTPPIAGGAFAYTWQFYDNNTGTGAPLSTSNNTNPVFAYVTAGQKLIRLSVKDVNAAGNCTAVFDALVNISPSLVAKINVTDLSNNPIVPDFCQEASGPLTTFQARFNDASVGVTTPTTLWRWEFEDEAGTIVRREPAAGFSTTILGPFDQPYVNRGIYKVRLIIRDNITACETIDEVQIRVFEKPVPAFTATRVCEGQPTVFLENSTLNPINGEAIVLREWDFNYDGVTFNKDPAFDNQSSFNRSLVTPGVHQVALRTTTNQHACSDMLVVPVQVDPLPNSSFTPDKVSGCSVLSIVFTNTSVAGQPDVVDQYIWEVDEGGGLGFQSVGVQHPTDPGFTNSFQHDFDNPTSTDKLFDVRLHVVTANGCERMSAPVTITAFPGTRSGFISTNYSPFNNNCSPVSVDFSVDAQTQSLNPTDYTWTISDVNGVVSSTSTGTTPSFTGVFTNNTLALKDFSVLLTTTLPGGCFGDSTRTIRVSPVPISDFDIDTLAFDCQQLNLHFSATQKGLPEYHWVIKENGITVFDATSTNDAFDYLFNRPPSPDIAVQVSLETKNFANCQSPITAQNVTVPKLDNMNASFVASPASQSLPGSTVNITNSTNPGPWQYLWDFGDGVTSTSSAPALVHTYATYGMYTIMLTVTNNVCVETQSQQVEILAIPPIVDFAYVPASGCVPLTVQFTNLSQFADPSTYVWELGDGQATSNAIDVSYTYYQPGTYTVSLSASNITGQTVKTTKSMIIEAYATPVSDFAVKPLLLYTPTDIMYTSNRSLNATSFLWDFGDGSTSTEVQPQHKYKAVGDYDISLIAFSINGCSDTTVLTSAVRVQEGGQVLIPNAFSPSLGGSSGGSGGSSDGKNDFFLPMMRGVVEFELLIFNRWGELLFESHDQNSGWDGYYHGRLCEQDVYVYKLSAVFSNGEKTVRTGDVNLIR